MRYVLGKFNNLIISGEAADIDDLTKKARTLHPHVIISGYAMQHINCVEKLCMLALALPQVSIIIYDNITDGNQLLLLKQAGIKGLLQKTTGLNFLIECVQAVHEGRNYFDKTSSRVLCGYCTGMVKSLKNKLLPAFNKTEMQIMKLTCQQKTNREIAATLYLSIEAIKSAKKTLRDKTSSKNNCGIVAYAFKNFLYK